MAPTFPHFQKERGVSNGAGKTTSVYVSINAADRRDREEKQCKARVALEARLQRQRDARQTPGIQYIRLPSRYVFKLVIQESQPAISSIPAIHRDFE